MEDKQIELAAEKRYGLKDTDRNCIQRSCFIAGAQWLLSQSSTIYNNAIDKAKSIVESNFSTKDYGTQATGKDSQLLLKQILDFLEKSKK